MSVGLKKSCRDAGDEEDAARGFLLEEKLLEGSFNNWFVSHCFRGERRWRLRLRIKQDFADLCIVMVFEWEEIKITETVGILTIYSFEKFTMSTRLEVFRRLLSQNECFFSGRGQ